MLAGCAGDGAPAAGGGGGGGGGGGAVDQSFVNLNGTNGTAPPGLIDAYFLPGQGRAPGSITAFLSEFRLQNGSGEEAEYPLSVSLAIRLDNYNVQSRPFSADSTFVPSPTETSRTFTDLRMTFQDRARPGLGFTRTADDGVTEVPYPNEIHAMTNQFLVTAFRGRVTALQLRLHDAMMDLQTDAFGNVTDIDFNTAKFIAENTNAATGKVTGFLSDYVAFDISSVTDKPTLMAGTAAGTPASTVFMSGDSYALSIKDAKGVNGSDGHFEVLTNFGTFEGFFRPAAPVTFLKTYELEQADPTYIGPPLRLITALKGTYRNVDDVVNNMKAFEFITFPKTGDGARQEIAILQRAGSTISKMWFGTADYATKTFKVYPIKNLQPASVTGEIRGSFTSFKDKNGNAIATTGTNWWRNIRQGNFRFNGTPAGIPAANLTGRFLVFRT